MKNPCKYCLKLPKCEIHCKDYTSFRKSFDRKYAGGTFGMTLALTMVTLGLIAIFISWKIAALLYLVISMTAFFVILKIADEGGEYYYSFFSIEMLKSLLIPESFIVLTGAIPILFSMLVAMIGLKFMGPYYKEHKLWIDFEV